MIITREEVKNILTITSTTYDETISYLIPFIQDDIIEYCNNTFEDKNTEYEASHFVLSSGEPPKISDTNGWFETYGFQVGFDIVLAGSYRNRGIYTISILTSDTMTLSMTDSLFSERSSNEYGFNTIRLRRIVWPKGLKLYAAQMIWDRISRAKNADIKSKSLGPSAITYVDRGYGGYPLSILKGLDKWKNMKCK